MPSDGIHGDIEREARRVGGCVVSEEDPQGRDQHDEHRGHGDGARGVARAIPERGNTQGA